MNNPTILRKKISADAAAFVAMRRDIHRHPELCFEETRTSDVIAQSLADSGIAIDRGWAKTGVVGIIKKGTSKRAIGLRADMDALPLTERNSFEHASIHPGRMHACGHDGHVAMLLSAAKALAADTAFDGSVYMIFQPAEEGGGGAREMLKEGLLNKYPMDAIFGVHNWPGLKVGQFALKTGPIFASSSEFKITIRGKGSHAAMPHLGVDPILTACSLVQTLQSIITRNKTPIEAGVLSVTLLHAGEATNVIADSCEVRGTVRTFTTAVLDLIERRMQVVAESVCRAHEAACEFEFRRNYPPTINHVQETEFVRGVLTEMVGEDSVVPFEPTMGAEDFSYFLQERPGCYVLIGSGDGEHRFQGHGEGPCMLHNPSFDFNDDILPLGAEMWVRLVERWLAQLTSR